LETLPGIGKAISGKIINLLHGEKIDALERLLNKTPLGILEIMNIKGLGAKKVAILWKEHHIDQISLLLKACKEERLANIKGFGEKTQKQIQSSIEFYLENQSKYLYAEIESSAEVILDDLLKAAVKNASFVGAIRRKCEIIEMIEIVVEADTATLKKWIEHSSLIEGADVSFKGNQLKGFTMDGFPLHVFMTKADSFWWDVWKRTGNEVHIKEASKKIKVKNKSFKSEESIYKEIGLRSIPPELREGNDELDWAKDEKNTLLETTDLKGVLHAHSTYSDGQNTLEEMAAYCHEEGYEYLGISDHSKTAVYAGGLQPQDIIDQHKEIDQLNKKFKSFKIFKGIESDILMDGSLDYPDEILATFDMVIISVHSVLNMKKDVATNRLLKAIEHPSTNILGHPTGRLLLRREGFPLDHEKVIDACIRNNVVLEINSNPYRLDIDWRWMRYASGKGAMFSVNPDAHVCEGIHDMRFGVYMARKGGLPASSILNTRSAKEVEKIFSSKK